MPRSDIPRRDVTLGQVVSLGWLSDYVTPTLFWIRNNYNLILNNHAVGTEFSGVCYWLVPSPMNHPSAGQRWNNTNINAWVQQPVQWQAAVLGYQSNSFQATSTPTLRFDGNSGSTCSSFIMTVADYGSNALNKAYPVLNGDFSEGNLRTQWAGAIFNTKYNYAMNNSLCHAPFGCDWEFPQPAPPNLTISTAQPLWCPDNATTTEVCKDCTPGVGNDCSYGVLVLSNFTGAFSYAELNFASIWMRTQFFVLTDAWLGEILGGGVNFANSGDPTGISIGFWGLVYRSVFIGSTQQASLYADFRGPVTPESALVTGVKCTKLSWGPPGTTNQSLGADMCVLPDAGLVVQYNLAGISQHYFHIYDGPMSGVDCHFANITANAITCFPLNITVGTDRPWCQFGISRKGDGCVNTNAAIGWKQPNGFDYPPGYLMQGMSFENVDLHHHVYLPQFLSGTFENDIKATAEIFCPSGGGTPPDTCNRTTPCPLCDAAACASNPCSATQYRCLDAGNDRSCSDHGFAEPSSPHPSCVSCQNCCNTETCLNDSGQFLSNFLNWNANWNSIDRQTNLKEMDGSVSLRKTTTGNPGYIINKDVFFYGPHAEPECGSLDTSYVLPHHFGRVYMLPSGWNSSESCRTFNAAEHCVVLRTHRLSFENSSSELPVPPVISAGPKGGMGQMFMEGTKYLVEVLTNPVTGTATVRNEWIMPQNQIYYLQMLYPVSYAKPNTFAIYVGNAFVPATDLQFCVFFKAAAQVSRPRLCVPQQQWANNQERPWLSRFITYTLGTDGHLQVTVDHTAVDPQLWIDGERERCVPHPFCKWNASQKTCGCGDVTDEAIRERCQDICSTHGGIANAECPGGGCMGFSFRIPNVPYRPPYNNNATQWLETNTMLFEQWSPAIKAQQFIGPPIGSGSCPTE